MEGATEWWPAPVDEVPEPWPQRHLVLRTPRLELRPDDDAGLYELIELVHGGVHPVGQMPFMMPWTQAEPAYLGRGMLQYFWSRRADLAPEYWRLAFLVRCDGRVAGVQDVIGKRFGVLREVDTGSYLGRAYQGRGLGTEMRAAVLAFAFDVLGARTARSGYLGGNDASAAVSRRLGYRPDGTALVAPNDDRVVEQRLLLERADFVRPEWTLKVEGYTPELAGLLAADPPAGR